MMAPYKNQPKENDVILYPEEMNISSIRLETILPALQMPTEKAFRISTLNQHGFMFTKFDPIALRFLESIEARKEQTVFEVGGAYGNVAQAALESGICAYYLNDREETHLKLFIQQLERNQKTHLFEALHLIAGCCPEEVKLKHESFDAILVNKVLHFCTPENIDAFVQWLYNGLKNGGKVYILTISPFRKGHESLLEDYEKRKYEGAPFPGYCPNYSTTIPGQNHDPKTCPLSLLFMELSTLKSLFQAHGFKIEEEFELSIINEDAPEWGIGKDMVGIIASRQAMQ